METVVITRHPALVELLIERGIIAEGTPVISHATLRDVRGKHVVGVLPLSLAVAAEKVTEVSLALTEEDRGKELGIQRLREIAGPPVTYKVEIVD
jgi:hypothetical protein